MTWWGDLTQMALVASSLIQVSDIVNRSISLSEINVEMAGYLLDIDLMF